LLLGELGRRGRMRGAVVCEVDEAIEYVRDMNSEIDLEP
jgi:hypothetical protein